MRGSASRTPINLIAHREPASELESNQGAIDTFITEAIKDGTMGRAPRLLREAKKWFSETDGELRDRFRDDED